MPFLPDWLNIVLIVLAALFLFVGVPAWMRGNKRRETRRADDAAAFWARHKREWIYERLCDERSQEYVDWLHEGHQKGYLR